VFAALRNGDLRCARADTGQVLGTSQVKRTGKRREATSVIFLNRQGFLFGDDGGGLTFVARDDLSEVVQLRKEGPSAVGRLLQIDEAHVAVVYASSLLEVVQLTAVNPCEAAALRLSVVASVQLEASTCLPGLGVVSRGREGSLVLAADTAGISTWRLHRSAGNVEHAKFEEVKQEHQESRPADPTLPRWEKCHLLALERPGEECCVVTASNRTESIHWWSLLEQQLRHLEVCKSPLGPVDALSTVQGLVVCTHMHAASVWHGAHRRLLVRLERGVGLPYILTFVGDSLLTAETDARGQTVLQLNHLRRFKSKSTARQDAEACSKEKEKKAKPKKISSTKSHNRQSRPQ